jgi:hypothetical protein
MSQREDAYDTLPWYLKLLIGVIGAIVVAILVVDLLHFLSAL